MHRWRRIHAEGAEWEVRVVSAPDAESTGSGPEILEFRPVGGTSQPRRVSVERGALDSMDDEALMRLHRRARPIGGDHYGRPGKTMDDVRS